MELVYVSVGSNIDRDHNVRSGVAALRDHYGTLALSPVYESRAEGFEGANFYNLVLSFCAEDVNATRASLKDIESRHQRRRNGPKFSDRTLDLDILLFGEQVLYEQDLDIPRREILKYAFVLLPLVKLAPQSIHPVNGISYAELWRRFAQEHPDSAEGLSEVSFIW